MQDRTYSEKITTPTTPPPIPPAVAEFRDRIAAFRRIRDAVFGGDTAAAVREFESWPGVDPRIVRAAAAEVEREDARGAAEQTGGWESGTCADPAAYPGCCHAGPVSEWLDCGCHGSQRDHTCGPRERSDDDAETDGGNTGGGDVR